MLVRKFFHKYKYLFLYIFLSVIFLRGIIFSSGVPFKYDWVWPAFGLGSNLSKIFNYSALFPDMFQKNGIMSLNIIGILFGSGLFFKIFLVSVQAAAGYGMYLFLGGYVKNKIARTLVGIFYAFTPYIFIRTIVGYTWSLLAYALTPIILYLYFKNSKKNYWDYLLIGFLLSLSFAQIQAGLLISLVLFVDLSMSGFSVKSGMGRWKIRDFVYTYLVFALVNLPWYVIFKFKNLTTGMISGNAATTLGYVAAMPHSIRNMLMLSDHQITSVFFYPLAHEKWYLLGWGLIWLIAFFGLLNKKTKNIVWPLFVSLLLIFPFLKGPVGMFGFVYSWFYKHFSAIAVFRETYHFQFLIAVVLTVMFAAGLDYLFGLTKEKWQKTGLYLLIICLVATGIYPYFTRDYAGYLKLQKIPQSYYQLNNYFKENRNACSRVYYPPALGFVKFRDDKTPNASNSDIIAYSLGVPYVDDGTTFSYLPSPERYWRNELVSQFYEKQDDGQFAALLNEKKVDCVVVRTDLTTMYKDASNLHLEKDKVITKKWLNEDYLNLTESKKGLKKVAQFGSDIYIFKPDSSYKIQPIDHSSIEKLPEGKKEILPITNWAYNFAYYKDGWSRGRYDFWRKLLFSELREDFIYTDKKDAVVEGKVPQRGSYELWIRYLSGGTPGNFQIQISNEKFNVYKDAGEEQCAVKKLGDVDIKDGQVKITNISGENAIADLWLMKK